MSAVRVMNVSGQSEDGRVTGNGSVSPIPPVGQGPAALITVGPGLPLLSFICASKVTAAGSTRLPSPELPISEAPKPSGNFVRTRQRQNQKWRLFKEWGRQVKASSARV